MRANIIGRRIPNPAAKSVFLLPSSSFCSSSGRGRGRGVGGGFSDTGKFDFVRAPGKPEESEHPNPSAPPPQPKATGRGDGNFSSFISSLKTSKLPIGRGRAVERPPEPQGQPRLQFVQSGEENGGSGVGRGKPAAAPPPRVTEENRHVRASPKPKATPKLKPPGEEAARPKLSREEAVKRAVAILSKGGGDGPGGRSDGVGQGRGRGGLQSRGGRFDDYEESGDLDVGDDKDGERLAELVGVENMQKLMEGFEEMSGRVLPDPEEDAFVDAMHTNYAIEFEPEYLFGEFGQNPDIDEKPPMTIREMLEKVKPFIMAYEGIESQEEWEEVVEEVMKRVPLLKEIVDHYSGPDRVTAKKQHEELERVAKTIPASAPASVKQFTDRAVLSLQSNPGWGFDKKCQFMDKLAREVNQCYK